MDDEEELVRQVINENPPDDRGVRPEWDLHEGWHRVEDIREGHSNLQQSDAEQTESGHGREGGGDEGSEYNAKDDDPLEPTKEETPGAQIHVHAKEPVKAEKHFDGVDIDHNDALGRAARDAQQQQLRGTKVWGRIGNSANEKALPTIPKPMAIGLAAVVFFAYVAFERRRMSKSTKDML